ncbi:glutathione S-transferase family protein [Neisseria sp. Ec49-e6-T10]|uniref:glutathione S-transferase family protein n=1 Tax=Neisseria sp. Ec49-e6-T10 TaxID=3140744 RepID=UPI003EBEC968
MTQEVIFYTHPMSRGCTIRWVLEEIGQPYQTQLLEYGTTMKAPEFLNINPVGKVPAISHQNTIVTETAAICAYLADAFPDAHLAPLPNDPKRGAYYRWLFFASGPLEMGMTNQQMGFNVTEEQKKMVGYGQVDEMLTILETRLAQNTYLLGSQFTVADIYVGSFLGWAMYTEMIHKPDVFVRYYETLQARPAAIRAKDIDDRLWAQMSS